MPARNRGQDGRLAVLGTYGLAFALVGVLSATTFLYEWCAEAGAQEDPSVLPPQFARLLPLHTKLGKPEPGDWLDRFPEVGQAYEPYLRSRPVRANATRSVIYVQPLGDFSPSQRKIIEQASEFLGLYYQLPVRIRRPASLEMIPKSARRKLGGRSEQILSTYVLDRLLRPRLPKDAVALIAFTAADLWPGEGWNYVFGQASLADRVGVWSIHRFGDPAAGDEAFRLCLLRTLKTATHETGHMFSMPHCTFYECNLCGSNHLAEGDRRPLELCPVCLAKLCYATGADPAKRFQALIEFHKKHGLKAEQDFCEKSLAALNEK
jgi:archaemetzincin